MAKDKKVKPSIVPGTPMILREFKSWIRDSERDQGITLSDAKKWWVERKVILKN